MFSKTTESTLPMGLLLAALICSLSAPKLPPINYSGGVKPITLTDMSGDGIGDYATVADAIEAGEKGTIRAVDGGCGACNGPRNSKGGNETGRGNYEKGNGGGSFWDKVKDFFSGRRR